MNLLQLMRGVGMTGRPMVETGHVTAIRQMTYQPVGRHGATVETMTFDRRNSCGSANDSSPLRRSCAERDLVKTAALGAAIADAFEDRGVPARDAGYVAQAATMAFVAGVDDWSQQPELCLTACIRAARQSLRAALDADQSIPRSQ